MVPMAGLVLPTTDVRRSFLAAMAEFIAEGRGVDGDDTMVGGEIRDFSASWHTARGFAAVRHAVQVRSKALVDDAPASDGSAGLSTSVLRDTS
jgi:hypothetical protein